MLVALDYDGTYTNDPAAWLLIVRILQGMGHEVILATMRYPSECKESTGGFDPIDPRLRSLGVRIIPTSREGKQPFLQKMGIEPTIWIDDQPAALLYHASIAFGAPATPEGHTHDPAKEGKYDPA